MNEILFNGFYIQTIKRALSNYTHLSVAVCDAVCGISLCGIVVSIIIASNSNICDRNFIELDSFTCEMYFMMPHFATYLHLSHFMDCIFFSLIFNHTLRASSQRWRKVIKIGLLILVVFSISFHQWFGWRVHVLNNDDDEMLLYYMIFCGDSWKNASFF